MQLQPWMIGTLVTISVFLLGHLGAAIWFASRVSAEIRGLVEDLKTLSAEVRTLTEQNQRIAVLDQRVLTLERDAREIREQLRAR